MGLVAGKRERVLTPGVQGRGVLMVPEHRVVVVGVDVAMRLMTVAFTERLLDLHVLFLLEGVPLTGSPVAPKRFQDSMPQSVDDQNEGCDSGSRGNNDGAKNCTFLGLEMLATEHFGRDFP